MIELRWVTRSSVEGVHFTLQVRYLWYADTSQSAFGEGILHRIAKPVWEDVPVIDESVHLSKAD